MKTRLSAFAAIIALATTAFSPALAPQALAHSGPGTHERSGHLDHRDLPSCDAQRVLTQVTDKAETSYADAYPPVHVEGYDHIRQNRHVGSLGEGLRERRWCQARAHLADGRTRTVFYLIEGFGGFAGIRYGVDSCISGHDFDRWNIYGAHCSTVRAW